jgi:hypothetical protein
MTRILPPAESRYLIELFWFITAMCTGLCLLMILGNTKAIFRGKRLALSVLLVTVLAAGFSTLSMVGSYAYYFNVWANIFMVPFAALWGLLLLALTVMWLDQKLIYPPLLCLIPIACFYSWIYMVRPNGVLVQANSPTAYACFFNTKDAME